jgi:hypothetical protein
MQTMLCYLRLGGKAEQDRSAWVRTGKAEVLLQDGGYELLSKEESLPWEVGFSFSLSQTGGCPA